MNLHNPDFFRPPAVCCREFVCQRPEGNYKTNLLYDATATLNGAVEVRFSDQWTGEVGANLNAWAIDGGHPVEALGGSARKCAVGSANLFRPFCRSASDEADSILIRKPRYGFQTSRHRFQPIARLSFPGLDG